MKKRVLISLLLLLNMITVLAVFNQGEKYNFDKSKITISSLRFIGVCVYPESIRFNKSMGTLIWSSEGNINDGIEPFINEIHSSGKFVRSLSFPNYFNIDTLNISKGPRHNGPFDGISLSIDVSGYWISMEHPLIQDGEAPTYGVDLNSPVRILYIDKKTGKSTKQFTYELESAARKGTFMINGVTEILEYEFNKFLFIERLYSSDHEDGGNNIRIYKVNAVKATNVAENNFLKDINYTKEDKSLLFDFESIRKHLSSVTKGFPKIDNIEGISFGPLLENGNRFLVVVADNNFNAFGAQLNQFIVFELIP